MILGSSRPQMVKGASETLAGRVGFLDLGGFRLSDPAVEPLDRLWLRGAFPSAFTADSDEGSWAWRADFARGFWERDLPALGFSLPPGEIRRFWTLISHYHGQVVNFSDIARTLGTSCCPPDLLSTPRQPASPDSAKDFIHQLPVRSSTHRHDFLPSPPDENAGQRRPAFCIA